MLYRAALCYALLSASMITGADSAAITEKESAKNRSMQELIRATNPVTNTSTGKPSAEQANQELITRQKTDNYDTLNAFLSEVEQQEAQYGVYDAGLAEIFYGLGKTLQQLDRHNEAIDAFKQAKQINRVNYGLHSITQEPMIRGIMTSLSSQGNVAEIAKQYYRLLRIYEKTYGPDGQQLIPVLKEASAWHRNIYLSFRTPEYLSHLLDSATLTDAVVEIINRTDGAHSARQIDALKELALNCYYLGLHYRDYQNGERYEKGVAPTTFGAIVYLQNDYGQRRNNFIHETMYDYLSFRTGRFAYMRLHEVLQKNNASAEQQAEAIAALGDWFNLFNKKGTADEIYRQAWELLDESGDNSAQLALFGKPKLLPNLHFLNASDTQQNSAALQTAILTDYPNSSVLQSVKTGSQFSSVKLSFHVSQWGKPSNFSIMETLPENSPNLAKKVRRLWRYFKFRARYDNGQAVATSDHQLILTI